MAVSLTHDDIEIFHVFVNQKHFTSGSKLQSFCCLMFEITCRHRSSPQSQPLAVYTRLKETSALGPAAELLNTALTTERTFPLVSARATSWLQIWCGSPRCFEVLFPPGTSPLVHAGKHSRSPETTRKRGAQSARVLACGSFLACVSAVDGVLTLVPGSFLLRFGMVLSFPFFL